MYGEVDGSKIDNSVESSVYGIKPKLEVVASLGNTCTVFQAEVHAIELCLRELLNKVHRKRLITILSADNKASTLPFTTLEIKSKLVSECLNV